MVETLREKSYRITCRSVVSGRDVRGDCSCGKFSFVLGDVRLSEVGTLICEHLKSHEDEEYATRS